MADEGFDLKNPKEWFDAIMAALKLVFGPDIPPYVLRCLGWVLLALIALLVIWAILLVAGNICAQC
jgi:hypothetical protein